MGWRMVYYLLACKMFFTDSTMVNHPKVAIFFLKEKFLQHKTTKQPQVLQEVTPIDLSSGGHLTSPLKQVTDI